MALDEGFEGMLFQAVFADEMDMWVNDGFTNAFSPHFYKPCFGRPGT